MADIVGARPVVVEAAKRRDPKTHAAMLSRYRERYATIPKVRATAIDRAMRRRRVEIAGDVTVEFIAELLKMRKCSKCQCFLTRKPGPRQVEIDHILPLNAGGVHSPGNLRALCRTCNRSRPKDGSDLLSIQLPMVLTT